MKLNGKPGEDLFVKLTANITQFSESIGLSVAALEKLSAAISKCEPLPEVRFTQTKIDAFKQQEPSLRYTELIEFVSSQNTLLPREQVERIAAKLFQELNQQIDSQFLNPPTSKPKAPPPKVRRAIALNGVPRG